MAIFNSFNKNVKFRASVHSGYISLKNISFTSSPPDYVWKVNPETGECEKVLRKKRGKITGFSSASRRRLLKTLFSLTEYPEHFITLTYPKEFPLDSRKWKRDIDTFEKALKRAFPRAWFVWKLEPQKRGAPHFHLLGSFRQTSLTYRALCEWLSYTWYRIVGSGDVKHLKAGTNIKLPDSKVAVRKYISKYTGKTFTLDDLPDCWGEPGRFWGIIGRANFPKRDALYLDLDFNEFVQVRRFLKRWLRSIARRIRKGKKRLLSYSNRVKNSCSFFVFIDCGVILRFILELRFYEAWHWVEGQNIINGLDKGVIQFLYSV